MVDEETPAQRFADVLIGQIENLCMACDGEEARLIATIFHTWYLADFTPDKSHDYLTHHEVAVQELRRKILGE